MPVLTQILDLLGKRIRKGCGCAEGSRRDDAESVATVHLDDACDLYVVCRKLTFRVGTTHDLPDLVIAGQVDERAQLVWCDHAVA